MIQTSNNTVIQFAATRFLNEEETAYIKNQFDQFFSQWEAHGKALKASLRILADRHLIVAIDEDFQEATGCSKDKLTHFVQALGQKIGLDLMDRMTYTYKKGEDLMLVHHNELNERYADKSINEESLFFDNFLQKMNEHTPFFKPLKDSIHNRFVSA